MLDKIRQRYGEFYMVLSRLMFRVQEDLISKATELQATGELLEFVALRQPPRPGISNPLHQTSRGETGGRDGEECPPPGHDRGPKLLSGRKNIRARRSQVCIPDLQVRHCPWMMPR